MLPHIGRSGKPEQKGAAVGWGAGAPGAVVVENDPDGVVCDGEAFGHAEAVVGVGEARVAGCGCEAPCAGFRPGAGGAVLAELDDGLGVARESEEAAVEDGEIGVVRETAICEGGCGAGHLAPEGRRAGARRPGEGDEAAGFALGGEEKAGGFWEKGDAFDAGVGFCEERGAAGRAGSAARGGQAEADPAGFGGGGVHAKEVGEALAGEVKGVVAGVECDGLEVRPSRRLAGRRVENEMRDEPPAAEGGVRAVGRGDFDAVNGAVVFVGDSEEGAVDKAEAGGLGSVEAVEGRGPFKLQLLRGGGVVAGRGWRGGSGGRERESERQRGGG